MNPIATLLRRLRYLARLRSNDAELAEELASHQAFAQDAFARAGLGENAAATASRRAMGDVTRMREDARAVWVRPWIETMLQDVTYAFRGLRRQPGFSVVAILTLGIAIGLNASVFTAFNGVYWRPWPVATPAQVFEVTTIRDGRERHSDFSLAEFNELSARTSASAELAGMACSDGFSPGCDLWLDDAALRPAYLTAGAFHVFGVPMELGRAFAPDEERDGAIPVVVLSDELWHRRFAADSNLVNRQIHLDGVAVTVVGVAPPSFAGMSALRTDAWLPLASLSQLRRRDATSHRDHLQLAARVQAGVTPAQLRSNIETIITGMRASEAIAARAAGRGATRIRVSATTLDPNPGKRSVGYALFGLMYLGSALVILLACANLANLYLARAAARAREIAVRVSLGASRQRVIRQLLTENLVVAGAATALGVGIAFVGPAFLLRMFAADSLSIRPTPDFRVLAYAAAVAAFTCLAFGLTPAFHATRSVGEALKTRQGAGRSTFSLRHIFLAIQVAVSVIVLSGSAFLMRGVSSAASQEFRFNWEGVSTIVVTLPSSLDSATGASFSRDFTAAIARRPDAHLIAATTALPFAGRGETLVLKPGQDSANAASMFTLGVSGEYFDVLEIPTLSGRGLVASDAGGNAIVINEAAADRLWPRQNPIGQTLIIGSERHVVGVVRNADTEGRAAQEGAILAKVYEPILADRSAASLMYVARGASPQVVREITTAAHALVPAARITTQSLAESLRNQASDLRSDATVVAILGGVSLILVSIGIFGVFAFVVHQRTREIGIRLALGARGGDVIRLVIGSSMKPIVIGLGIGLVGAVAESFAVRGFVYGVSPVDPITYALIVVVLGAAATIAVYLPARRASRIVPNVALRVD